MVLPSTQIHSPKPAKSKVQMARRAALGSFLGSVVEYYDFFVYGTAAALLFGELFFPAGDEFSGTLASLATFGVAYIARPTGAILFGNLGDRLGRKKVLLATLLLMGASTFAIGLLPTYDAIGWWAPLLLVVCRLLQGISAGGEQVGASLLTMEHTPAKKRGLYTSWLLNGAAIGSLSATAIFIPLEAMPREALLAWGWRIPFLISCVVVLVSMVVRMGVDESPEFSEGAKKSSTTASRFPIAVLFRTQLRAALTVFVSAFSIVISTVVMVFGLSYATSHHGVDRPGMLAAISGSQFVALACHPLFGALADKVGRKKIFVIGSFACAFGAFGFFAAIVSGNLALIIAMTILLKGVLYAAPNALWPSFFAEQFSTDVRYTGVALSTQLSFLVTGFAPTICFALLGANDNWVLAASFVAGACVLAGIAASTAKIVPDACENKDEAAH